MSIGRPGASSVVLHGVSPPHVPPYELVPAPDHDGEDGEDRGVNRDLLPGAPKPERQVLPESLGGPLGLELLEQHGQNRRDEHRSAGDYGEQRRPREERQRVSELPYQRVQPASVLSASNLVRPVLLQAPGGLARGDALESGAEMTGQRVEALFRIEARLGSDGTRGSGSPRRGASR